MTDGRPMEHHDVMMTEDAATAACCAWASLPLLSAALLLNVSALCLCCELLVDQDFFAYRVRYIRRSLGGKCLSIVVPRCLGTILG